MNSERIKCLASFINKTDIVLDVGCDHGYLSIYLKKNNICSEVYASDISSNAINYAIKNFKKYNVNIEYFVSGGFVNIPKTFNTAVIAGMGTSTILHILDSKNIPNKLILASNNELYKLRKSLNKMGYKIIDEKVIKENNHFYNIICYEKGKEKLKKKYLKYGKSNNKEYFEYLINKNNLLIKKVPLIKKIILKYENKIISSLI